MTQLRLLSLLLLAVCCTASSKQAPLRHVALATDGQECISLVAAARSVLSSTATPDRLVIHVLHTNFSHTFRQCLECNQLPVSPLPLPGHMVVHDLNITWISNRIRVTNERTQRLTSLATYARLFIPEVLGPEVESSLYLDCDTIVQDDVVAFIDKWHWKNPKRTVLAAANYRNVSTLSKAMLQEGRQRYNQKNYHLSRPNFNTGVFLLNHRGWRTADIATEVLHFMKRSHDAPHAFYSLGIQPPLQLAAYGRWERLPDEWNYSGLGKPMAFDLETAEVKKQSVLHWAGSMNKPWHNEPALFKFWIKHLLPKSGPVCRCVRQDKRLDAKTPLRVYVDKEMRKRGNIGS
eukprot:m.41604 g.41604  ORF g.41604 m.41604 type:complete len:348 (+) comp12842_c0_seq1:95-1138(+)